MPALSEAPFRFAFDEGLPPTTTSVDNGSEANNKLLGSSDPNKLELPPGEETLELPPEEGGEILRVADKYEDDIPVKINDGIDEMTKAIVKAEEHERIEQQPKVLELKIEKVEVETEDTKTEKPEELVAVEAKETAETETTNNVVNLAKYRQQVEEDTSPVDAAIEEEKSTATELVNPEEEKTALILESLSKSITARWKEYEIAKEAAEKEEIASRLSFEISAVIEKLTQLKEKEPPENLYALAEKVASNIHNRLIMLEEAEGIKNRLKKVVPLKPLKDIEEDSEYENTLTNSLTNLADDIPEEGKTEAKNIVRKFLVYLVENLRSRMFEKQNNTTIEFKIAA